MATDLTTTIRAHLVAAGFSNIAASDRWPSGDQAILVLDAPGLAPQKMWGDQDVYRSGIQVLVRDASNQFGRLKATVGSVRDALHKSSPTGTVGCVLQGTPLPLDRDGDDRPIYSLNFLVTIQE